MGLAHGFVSSGLFICAGGVLYDRSHTRLITFYRGIAQLMPLFSILFFILSLGNCGVPLTLNFVGEFLSLYGVFERLPLLGVFASSSIIFSAAYTIYMFNRIAFAGSYSKFLIVNIIDLNKREFYILLVLVVFTVLLGIYPAPILDGLHYSVSSLVYILPLYISKKSKQSKIEQLKKSIAHIRINNNRTLDFIKIIKIRLLNLRAVSKDYPNTGISKEKKYCNTDISEVNDALYEARGIIFSNYLFFFLWSISRFGSLYRYVRLFSEKNDRKNGYSRFYAWKKNKAISNMRP